MYTAPKARNGGKYKDEGKKGEKKMSVACPYCGGMNCMRYKGVFLLVLAVVFALQALNYITLTMAEWVVAVLLGLKGLMLLAK